MVCVLNLCITINDIIVILLDFSVQDSDGVSSQQVIQLKPQQEVRGHPLGPASLLLSPHQSWLASVGGDGLLHVRETDSMVETHFDLFIYFLLVAVVCSLILMLHLQERFIELRCHSHRVGGVRSVSFSADSQMLLTAGFKDSSIVCTNLR